jgi:N-acetylneuraminic acid mutarotase
MISAPPRNLRLPLILALAAAAPGSASGSERVLSFEDRFACREAIERVYYSHQIGATRPFEEAVPREVLERKVRTSLLQSVALEQWWRTSITAESLERELDRIVRNTRLPERLLEVYSALGNDSVLIQECLARPVLVERLARNFFSRDQRIHSTARREAEELRARLASGSLDPRAEDSHRSEVEIVREDLDQGRNDAGLDSRNAPGLKDRRLVLSPLEFDEWRRRAPEQVGQIGVLVEERERFVVSVALEEGLDWARLASYAVPKESWDHWWQSSSLRLDAERAAAVALPLVRLPDPVGRVRSEPVGDQNLLLAPRSEGDSGPPCEPHEAWKNGILDDALAYRARYGHTAVWNGSVMVIWGGASNFGYLDIGGRYDPLTDAWSSTTTTNAPTGRFNHTAVWTGSVMVVWGGSAGGQQYLTTGGRYNPASDTWTPTTIVNAPQAREMHTAVWTGDLMIVWGGRSGGVFFNTGGRYDPVTDSWKATQIVNALERRADHTAVWTGSVMVVWGGSDFSLVFSNGGRYDPVADTWSPTTTTNAPEARSRHTAVWTGTLMVVWGGRAWNGLILSNGGRYDPAADTWSPTTTLNAPEAREDHTAVWTGSLMVVWGGSNVSAILDTGGKYEPVSDSWTRTTTVDAPEARYSHTAVWTESLIVVWGGYDGESYFNTGGRYDPVADTWTPTSTGAGPEARTGHTAVWTGIVMVVWGGYGDGYYFATGSRYDPLTDSWLPTSTLEAPEGRSGHTAVWTGSVMVVWGGHSADAGFNTGGRYDPLTDTWAPTTTVNAPWKRYRHTAVWTGSLMVVWGGSGGGGSSKTGGRYDPIADAWAATSTVNAPQARFDHTAVWTGTVMVIWGGRAGIGIPGFLDYFRTGGRYDPLSDTWAPTATMGAAKRRCCHTAVWTGSVMVVWGGFRSAADFTQYLNTGARYDPVADAWSPTTTANAPEARNYHTAVWTGSRVIVWGGGAPDPDFNTGGRYDPVADAWAPTTTANAPEARRYHTAVWTGSAMLVWGGSGDGPVLDTGGQYGLFETCASWWRPSAEN